MKGGPSLTATVLCKLVLVSVLLQISLGFELFDDDSRQSIISHLEKPSFWSLLDDKKQSGDAFPYTRLDRKIFRLPQTIIPYPRAGRMILDPDTLDYDLSLIPDYALSPDYPFPDIKNDKRVAVGFPPRFGRKKRSISSDKSDAKNSEEWSSYDEDFEPDFFRSDRAGSRSRSRNAFVPRVGKKSAEGFLEDIEESKRALAFTPRIGRASLIPRIGRNDPRFKVKSRGAFIPRIGRRAAALAPRIGRSEGSRDSE